MLDYSFEQERIRYMLSGEKKYVWHTQVCFSLLVKVSVCIAGRSQGRGIYTLNADVPPSTTQRTQNSHS